MKSIKIDQLKTFIAPDLIVISDALAESVARHGVVVPAVLCGDLLVDGHQRLLAAKKCGLDEIPALTFAGSAPLAFAELNRHRSLAVSEIVAGFFACRNDSSCGEFLDAINLVASPQLWKILEILSENLKMFSTATLNALPLNVWRELGHLEGDVAAIAAWMVAMNATSGEKRLIAGLLRQAARRKALPPELMPMDGTQAIAWLQQIVQPRRSAAAQKLAAAMAAQSPLSGVSLKSDQTFEKPGIDITLHVTRSSLDRFDKARQLVQRLFAEVEEL